jgi:hypothetical protein
MQCLFLKSNGVSKTSKHQMEHIINRSLGGGGGREVEFSPPSSKSRYLISHVVAKNAT